MTSRTYDAAGRPSSTTDPRGIVAKSYYDTLDRTTKTIEAYTDGTPTDNTNKTTEFAHDGDGNRLTLKADLPAGAYQTTAWVYGISTTTDSDISGNDTLSATQYPDKTTGNPSSSQQETWSLF